MAAVQFSRVAHSAYPTLLTHRRLSPVPQPAKCTVTSDRRQSLRAPIECAARQTSPRRMSPPPSPRLQNAQRPTTPRQLTPRRSPRHSPFLAQRQLTTATAHAPIPKSPCAGARLPMNVHAGFSVEDMILTSATQPDLASLPLKSQLFEKLGVGSQATINRLPGFLGGRNQGMWMIRDGDSELVLKMVRNERGLGGLPAEADKLIQLYHDDPSIVTDRTLAFPTKIVRCVGSSGERSIDIIVMRKVCGEQLSDVFFRLIQTGKSSEIGPILSNLGRFLKQFHKRYGNKQHGDFAPQNIFYDASSNNFSLVDIADIGHFTVEGDVAHFIQSLKILSSVYGQQFPASGKRYFEDGYKTGYYAV